MDIFAIAIGTFDPPQLLGNLKPDTRVAKRPLAPVTGHAIAVDKLCFWSLDRHLGTFPFPVNWIRSVMSDETGRSK
jgi:hypothetical protein